MLYVITLLKEKLFKKYLEYYSMDEKEFYNVIDKWANQKLFYKNNENKWTPKFEIH